MFRSAVMMKQILFLFIATFTVVFSVYPNEPCDTPLDELGHITLLRDCPSLFEKTKKKPILLQDEELINDSVQLRDGRKVYVCCPLEASDRDTTDAVTEPEKKWKENDICRTPDNKQGTCQKLKSCKSLYRKFKEEKDNTLSVRFLQESFCFKKGSASFVCCVDKDIEPEEESSTEVPDTTSEETIEEETGPAWLRELREKVPKAPECGFDIQDRIFNGEVTDITDFPWTALLEYSKPGNGAGFNCGGSLINSRYVLTAAHCVDSIPDGWKLENVVLGEWDVLTEYDCDRHGTCSVPVVVKKVVKTIVHERYRDGANNKHDDIALLRLASEVDFTNFVSPICLPLNASQWKKNYSGDKLYAAGWGRTENNKVSTKKLKVDLPFRTFNECNRQYRALGITLRDQHHICAGIEGKDTCKGDSGGSLMYYDIDRTVPFWYAVGVVSFGGDACGQSLLGVYTKVENYLEWINENIE